MEEKSTLKEIEERFDQDVTRFSNLDTGQQTTLDALFKMELITDGIAAVYPGLRHVLDIGCGAGNYPVKLAHKISDFDCTLVDLSQPMLDKAKERVQEVTSGQVECVKGDFRTVELKANHYDIIIATAVLHHLRDDQDWEHAFKKLYSLLKEGGSIWVFDLVTHDHDAIEKLIYTDYYGTYLTGLKDKAYRDHVFAYIEHEDTPRSLTYQLDLLKKVGFKSVDVLHKKLNFASFVAFKSGSKTS
jgi:tRNA (cmo5U34)-methyltransferase